MRISYREEGANGPIFLSSEGSIDHAETQLEKCSLWMTEFMAIRGSARTGEIMAAGQSEHYSDKTLKSAMKLLTGTGVLWKPKRGVYTHGAGTKQGRDQTGTKQGPDTDQRGLILESPREPKSSGGAPLEAPPALAMVDPERD